MEKLLAALSLPQVGDIRMVPISEDPEGKGGLFALELNTRVYTLRAKDEEEAQLWVSTLTKLREHGLTPSPAPPSADKRAQNPSEIQGTKKLLTPDQSGATANWIKSGKSCFGCC